MAGSLDIANRADANGIAYRVIANAAAIAVQDGTDYLRMVDTVCATVIAISIAKFAVTKSKQDLDPIEPAQKAAKAATVQFTTIGSAAAEVLGDFA